MFRTITTIPNCTWWTYIYEMPLRECCIIEYWVVGISVVFKLIFRLCIKKSIQEEILPLINNTVEKPAKTVTLVNL